jgi:hypothetical protein
MVEHLREKAELEARLYRAERLSAIAHLASGIAHEVRNPLNSIRLIIDHLGAQFAPMTRPEQEEFSRLTSIIKQEIHRLNAMIETFLKYGKPLELKREATDVRTLLDEVLEVAAQKALVQQIRVKRDYAAALPQVWADRPYIKTCFLNLVLNALQAMMPSGGTLTVTVRNTHGDGGQLADSSIGQLGNTLAPGQEDTSTIRPMNGSTTDGWVEIRFQDTGVGIAPQDLPRIFEPYFTTKEVGIGLGLALTKQILEQDGARIDLTSEPGKGTLARIQFPAGVPET